MPRRLLAVLALPLVLAACEAPQPGLDGASLPRPKAPVVTVETGPDAHTAAANFLAVARDMEPRIESECLSRTHGRMNCDYQVMVDERSDPQPNAFQTLDARGRPIVAFNLALIAEARNRDELAFVMGHEAAHYILGHLEQKTSDATRGALILGALAAASGADADGVAQARDFGAEMGARAYSKDYELQADALGTVIAWNAGYNPERGAMFFTRLPDPGHSFLGTHPANGERIAVVHRVTSALRKGSFRGF
ncbi:peptidase M48-like protein [Rhodobacter viridis]|uniref:Peptidase M48-like protein n=1 Tax=Rhodobacter viridis TaxID=1054202 RepID=A0A318U379_9RHOB|nr:M48 family metallopeptidase [Rhodobacter viridis]PYF11100.1 peptidase M48-like protein [Rhodobacter viridis]